MPDPVGIRLYNVSVRYGSTVALDDVSLEVRPGEFFSLLGPSGCGKTTLLRVIAGFEIPDSGRLFIGERDVTASRPQARPTAMVFQNYALFPGMSVFQNVEYGLRVRKRARPDRERNVREALARVGLAELGDRDVSQLSGGQQQRVALARALAVEPDVLLFDEPLSNLDVALRDRTRRQLRSVQQAVGRTSVYVTHDQQEALGLSDRVAVMKEGTIVQVDTPEVLYTRPETAYVASFLGGANIVESAAIAETLSGEGSAPSDRVLSVRPADLHLSERGVEVEVTSSQFLGDYREVELRASDGTTIRAHLTSHVAPGESVRVAAARWRWVRRD